MTYTNIPSNGMFVIYRNSWAFFVAFSSLFINFARIYLQKKTHKNASQYIHFFATKTKKGHKDKDLSLNQANFVE